MIAVATNLGLGLRRLDESPQNDITTLPTATPWPEDWVLTRVTVWPEPIILRVRTYQCTVPTRRAGLPRSILPGQVTFRLLRAVPPLQRLVDMASRDWTIFTYYETRVSFCPVPRKLLSLPAHLQPSASPSTSPRHCEKSGCMHVLQARTPSPSQPSSWRQTPPERKRESAPPILSLRIITTCGLPSRVVEGPP